MEHVLAFPSISQVPAYVGTSKVLSNYAATLMLETQFDSKYSILHGAKVLANLPHLPESPCCQGLEESPAMFNHPPKSACVRELVHLVRHGDLLVVLIC